MSSVEYKHASLVQREKSYKLIADCYAGSEAVKNSGETYLPDPSPEDEDTTVKSTRYKRYVQKAVFYNTVRRTVRGLVGSVYVKSPVIEMPNELEDLIKNTDGVGLDIEQHSKKTLRTAILKGRAGLLTDYPASIQAKSKAEQKLSNIRPVIKYYEPESIINWRVSNHGAEAKLSLVVIKEQYVKSDDGFKQDLETQYLVLRLKDKKAISEIWRHDTKDWTVIQSNEIRNSKGQPFTELPFIFVGSENNDPTPDDSLVLDIAELSIAHYNDSADYQESNFIAGQPTLAIAGLSQSWVDTNFKKGVTIGSRSGLLLPEGGTAALLQAQSNSVNFEAMAHKERQMVALGARLIEPNQSTLTATEANMNNAEETSELASVAKNVSMAYTQCMKWACEYIGVNSDECNYQLNTEFNFNKMTPQQRQQLMAEWQGGAITWNELRDKLVNDGIATELDAKKAKKQIDEELSIAGGING